MKGRLTPAPAAPTLGDESLEGWGYADTRFVVRPDESVVLTGDRYDLCKVTMPGLMPWFSEKLGVTLSHDNRNEARYPPGVPEPRRSPALTRALDAVLSPGQMTDDAKTRLRHGHGHTGAEIWAVRYERLPRVPDLVVFPESHDQVVGIVEASKTHGACVIPYGGGTNVTQALRLPLDEDRVVVAVDMRRMNRVLWIEPDNGLACVEAGATGAGLATEFEKYGLTMGHEPDSLEFSTLGGWIATNASGMKKNRYGNIEDLVLDVTLVTAEGVVERPAVGPRESVGVNPRNFVFGSEGNLGIVTRAVVRLKPLPAVRRYGSVLFPNLAAGLAFMKDLERSGALPASVRVVDNTQFHFGQALKGASQGVFAKGKSALEKFVVTKVKAFDPFEMAAATLVFEGSFEEVAFQERTVYRLARRHRGMKAGSANGERGYQLTFAIAYIRDLTFTHWAIAESFETSVPWSGAMDLYRRVRERIEREHAARGLPGKPFFTGRVTQAYPTGVAMYFYLGFYAKGVDDPVRRYTELEHAAREEILASGGSLSHHHGIGKLRQDFMPAIYSPGARHLQTRVKEAIDPGNVFGARNHAVLGEVDF
jgi:alkyldihydroxyacetonephosphate synthase